MTRDLRSPPVPASDEPSAGRRVPGRGSDAAAKQRTDPRLALDTQAFVSIASLPTRAYSVREISRSGMFLGFRDPRSTRQELERNGIDQETPVDIAFVVASGETKDRFNVGARIRRITRDGIGVVFVTRNPPQLAALREIFSHAAVDEAS